MFTGIVQGTGEVITLDKAKAVWRLEVASDTVRFDEIEIGASIAVDGVCLTVVTFKPQSVAFDVIPETYNCTTLGQMKVGDKVNLERAARIGDEIGGHLLSGHVCAKAHITAYDPNAEQVILACQLDSKWLPYILPKGYIAINGVSLTVVEVNEDKHTFTVHLIPETRHRTTFAEIQRGDLVNIEIDAQTQAIVDTVKRYTCTDPLIGCQRHS